MTASERIREARMAQDETYNGWSNYPTWAVNLWLSNDEGLYNEARERVQNTVEAATMDPNVEGEIWTIEEARRYWVSDHLKNWVSDELAPDLGATFAADLLGYALACVNWDEIASAWIEDVSAEVDS